MRQLTLFELSDAALDAAKNLIRVYVKRGDTLESLHRSYLGSTSPDGMDAQIGGDMNQVRYTNNQLLVKRDVNGKVVDRVFTVKEIYDLVSAE